MCMAQYLARSRPVSVMPPLILTFGQTVLAIVRAKLYGYRRQSSINTKGPQSANRRGAEVLKEEPLRQEWWPWNPPSGDFSGYLVDVYRLDGEGQEEILGSIGVDVSSDWKRFPRYGYAAWYEPGKEQWVGGDVAFLNRRHINAVQFQDWHWKHHWPYCGDETYTDIAMRDISLNVVKEFINRAARL